jgi:CRP/FNR family transcriptional regulator, cyclic AMP receptor protein
MGPGVRTLDELLADVPALAGLAAEQRELIAGCAKNVTFASGDYLMREGEPADTFFVIRHGAVAIETFVPARGPVTIETLHADDLLGWSWLVPPYRTAFDVRALETVRAMSFDGVCLRGKCVEDPVLGQALLERFTAVIVERLQATRLRLLDMYGDSPA